MHFEILVEDQSGKRALDILMPKIVSDPHTFQVIGYRGIGRLPKNLRSGSDPRKRLLLDPAPTLTARLWQGIQEPSCGGDRGM